MLQLAQGRSCVLAAGTRRGCGPCLSNPLPMSTVAMAAPPRRAGAEPRAEADATAAEEQRAVMRCKKKIREVDRLEAELKDSVAERSNHSNLCRSEFG